MVFQPLHQFIVEQRIQYDARRLLDLCQHAIKLLLRSHQRIDMLDRQVPWCIGQSPRVRRSKGLAGRIGYKVKVEIAACTLRHGKSGIAVNSWGEGHGLRPERKSQSTTAAQTVHIMALGTRSGSRAIPELDVDADSDFACRDETELPAHRKPFGHSTCIDICYPTDPVQPRRHVDNVWTAMHESNQRSNNYNKKNLKI